MRTIQLRQEGNARCATFSDFINLQESPAGFGETDIDAIKALLQENPMRCRKPLWWGWGGPAGHCNELAYGPSDVMRSQTYYLSGEIACCENHGGPSLGLAAMQLASFAAGLFPEGFPRSPPAHEGSQS